MCSFLLVFKSGLGIWKELQSSFCWNQNFQFSQQFSKAFWSTAYERSTWKSHADRGEVLLKISDLHVVPTSDWISLFAVLPVKGKSSLLLADCSVLALLLKHLFKACHGPQYLCVIQAMRLCLGEEQRQSWYGIPNVVAGIFLSIPCTWKSSWEEYSLLSKTMH